MREALPELERARVAATAAADEERARAAAACVVLVQNFTLPATACVRRARFWNFIVSAV